MKKLLALLTGIPGVTSSLEFILGLFSKYFPPKSEGERAVEKYKKKVTQVKKVILEHNKAIKQAKLGKTKALEDILNNPRADSK